MKKRIPSKFKTMKKVLAAFIAAFSATATVASPTADASTLKDLYPHIGYFENADLIALGCDLDGSGYLDAADERIGEKTLEAAALGSFKHYLYSTKKYANLPEVAPVEEVAGIEGIVDYVERVGAVSCKATLDGWIVTDPWFVIRPIRNSELGDYDVLVSNETEPSDRTINNMLDINKDGKLNVFDNVALKRRVIELNRAGLDARGAIGTYVDWYVKGAKPVVRAKSVADAGKAIVNSYPSGDMVYELLSDGSCVYE